MYRNVDAELKRNGMTRADLGKALNIAPSTMSYKLNGKSDITLQMAEQIKAILGVDMSLEELFEYTA